MTKSWNVHWEVSGIFQSNIDFEGGVTWQAGKKNVENAIEIQANLNPK